MIIWMLIGYMFLYIHRPFEVWPVLATVRLELLYMIATMLIWLVSPKTLNLNRLTFVIAIFAATMIFGWITSDYADEGTVTLTNWLKLLPFYLMIVTSVKDERDLKRIMTGFLVVMFVYMAHSLVEYYNGRHVFRMGIARMIGVDIAHSDPNSFAASIVYVLPMWLPFWRTRETRKQTVVLLGFMALALLSALLTGSRTGMLGLCAFALMCVLLSRRRLAMLFLIFMIGSAGWLSLPEELQTRYLTIVDDDVGPENAQISKNSRYLLLIESIRIWQDSPLLGYGPGSFAAASGSGMQAHTLYGQVLSELGLMGVVTLLGMIACFVINFWEARHFRRILFATEQPHNFEYQIILAVFMSLFLLLVLGVGGHNLYRYTWVWYAAFQGLALTFLRKQAEEYERCPEPAWEEHLPPDRAFG